MFKHEFGLKLRYQGGDADKHLLELYDGSSSLHGFSQAFQHIIHAYLHHDVNTKSTALKGGAVYLKATRPGSFVTDLIAVIDNVPSKARVSAASFYDFVGVALAKATGNQDVTPKTSSIKKLLDGNELLFDDLSETLEGGLQRAHRTISANEKCKIDIERPRGEQLAIFNKKTCQWVNTREEKSDIIELTGKVTRFNSETQRARIYINELRRIVPMKPTDEFPEIKKGALTWSLHGSNIQINNGLSISARQVESATGTVKRLLLVDCERI